MDEIKEGNLQKLITIQNLVQKQLILEALNQQEIAAVIKPTGIVGTLGYSAFGEEIYINERDYHQALAMLQELEAQETDIDELEKLAVGETLDDVETDSLESTKPGKKKNYILKLILLILGISLLLGGRWIVNHYQDDYLSQKSKGFTTAKTYLEYLKLTNFDYKKNVEWADIGFETEVKKVLNKNGHITAGELRFIQSMVLAGDSINSIEDIKYFPALRQLTLEGTQIKDLAPLKDLEFLIQVEIRGGGVMDISPLEQSFGMERLMLQDLPLTSIESVGRLENLVYLQLTGLPLEDVSSLEGNTSIDTLILQKLPSVSLKPLASTSIRSLEITETEITGLDAITAMSALEELKLNSIKVEEIPEVPASFKSLDLVGFLDVTSLNFVSQEFGSINMRDMDFTDMDITLPAKVGLLSIQNCGLRTLEILENCESIDWFYAPDNELTDISTLSQFENLKTLVLYHNPLQDIDIQLPAKIEYLDLENCMLDNLDFLSNCKQIRSLKVANNRLTDISGLPEGESMELLDLSNNGIQNTNIKLPNEIIEVNISNCGLKNLDILKNCRRIERLNASGNQITDSSILDDIKDLKIIDLSNNPIDNVDISGGQ